MIVTQIKKLVCCVIAGISFVASVNLSAELCPEVTQIKRAENQYHWYTSVPGWDGYFSYPTHGQGHSYHAQHFLSAEWIKLNDSPNSPGYIQCQYQGSVAQERITFIQQYANNAQMPQGINWSCYGGGEYPSVACRCSNSDPTLCEF